LLRITIPWRVVPNSPPIPQTKLSNDLFAALAKPGSQDQDPNYVIDYDTPE
jgi:hypothetical protein